MKTSITSLAMLIGSCGAGYCQFQADTSSYRTAPPPSALDYAERYQRLELQNQQIELQRMQIEQQRLQMQQYHDREMQRQLEFEHRQAEAYQLRQIGRGKAKAVAPPRKTTPPSGQPLSLKP